MLSINKLSLLSLLFSPALAQNSCGLCPEGSTLGEDKPVFSPDDPSLPASCSGFDDLLAVVPAAMCDSTRSAMLAPYNLQYYCECSGVEAPGVCDLCNGADVINADVPSDLLTGYTCGQFSDLAASVTTEEQCTTVSAAAALCCDGGGGDGATTPPVDGNVTATESPTLDATMSPADNVTSTAACPVCENGTSPSSDFIIPIIGVSCAMFEMLPIEEEQCNMLKGSIAVGALCGCAGEEPPSVCPLCGGAGLPDTVSNDTISINGLNFTCQEAQYFSDFANDMLCNTSVALFDTACCGGEAATSEPTAPATVEPTAAPAPTASGPTASADSKATHQVAGAFTVRMIMAVAAVCLSVLA